MKTSTHQQQRKSLTPLIQRDLLFGNPERTSPQLSPDGKYLAYLAPDDKNILQVWLQQIGKEDARILTTDKKRGIHNFFFPYNPDQLIYMQDSDGDENFHLYCVNIQTSIVRNLTPFPGIKAELVDLDPKFPDQLLVAMDINAHHLFDVSRINLNNGAVKFDTKNPGNVVTWKADTNFQVRAAYSMTPDGGADLLYRHEHSWEILRHWEPDEEGGLVSFSSDSKKVYIKCNHNSNTQRLIALDLATRQETVIAEDEQYDVGGIISDAAGILIQPTTRDIQAVSFLKEKKEWCLLDPTISLDFEAISQTRPGEISIVSRDLSDKNWIVAYSADDKPVYYYIYNRDSKTNTFLFSNKPKLEGLQLAPMQPISYKARDGLTIHGYLTTPIGIPAQNLPTVLLVHGGPWGRDVWGFKPEVQWLANRGYAVLQVNFRGSAGYGKAFLSAGNREWGGKMHDDLIDGVNWLVQLRIAEPKKIAIMGGSYGGYAALVGLTFTPEVFAAGIDIVGPSNLLTHLGAIPLYGEKSRNRMIFYHRVGNLETEPEFLKSRSPLFFAHRIQKPLLIAQGAHDPRVKQEQSEQIVETMRKQGLPVEYILYPDEGHGFARAENRLHFYAIAENFLAKYLDGRFEQGCTK